MMNLLAWCQGEQSRMHPAVAVGTENYALRNFCQHRGPRRGVVDTPAKRHELGARIAVMEVQYRWFPFSTEQAALSVLDVPQVVSNYSVPCSIACSLTLYISGPPLPDAITHRRVVTQLAMGAVVRCFRSIASRKQVELTQRFRLATARTRLGSIGLHRKLTPCGATPPDDSNRRGGTSVPSILPSASVLMTNAMARLLARGQSWRWRACL